MPSAQTQVQLQERKCYQQHFHQHQQHPVLSCQAVATLMPLLCAIALPHPRKLGQGTHCHLQTQAVQAPRQDSMLLPLPPPLHLRRVASAPAQRVRVRLESL